MDSIKVWLITGDPGIGKTTVILRLVNIIKAQGYTVGGVLSKEIIKNGERIGFDLIDISSNRKGILASIDIKVGPRIGKYRVNLIDLKEIGTKALLNSLDYCDITVCDEIGPMELFSPEFRRAIIRMINNGKIAIAIIHKLMRDPLIVELKKSPSIKLLEVTKDNRDNLPNLLSQNIFEKLEKNARE